MRPGLSCYRVTIQAPRPRALPWTMVGGDHPYAKPTRLAWPLIAAVDELEARERALVVGKEIMGGRDVEILSIELTCYPGHHSVDYAR